MVRASGEAVRYDGAIGKAMWLYLSNLIIDIIDCSD